MDILEYITTNITTQQEKDELSNRLRVFLDSVFSPSFANELYKIYKDIDIIEKARKDDVIAMTFLNKRIELNTPVFYALSKTEQAKYLAHELIHVAQNKGNLRIKNLAKKLWKFYNNNVIKGADISQVMVGKANVSKRWVNKNETVPYLINEPIRWQYLKPDSKEKFIDILKDSGMFNLEGLFWRKML